MGKRFNDLLVKKFAVEFDKFSASWSCEEETLESQVDQNPAKQYTLKEINLQLNLSTMIQRTGISKEDLINTMETFGITNHTNHGIQILLSLDMVEKYLKNKKKKLHVEPARLKWIPPKPKNRIITNESVRAADNSRQAD